MLSPAFLPTLFRSKIQDRVLGEGTVPGLLTLLSDMALSVPKQCFFSCSWNGKLLVQQTAAGHIS